MAVRFKVSRSSVTQADHLFRGNAAVRDTILVSRPRSSPHFPIVIPDRIRDPRFSVAFPLLCSNNKTELVDPRSGPG